MQYNVVAQADHELDREVDLAGPSASTTPHQFLATAPQVPLFSDRRESHGGGGQDYGEGEGDGDSDTNIDQVERNRHSTGFAFQSIVDRISSTNIKSNPGPSYDLLEEKDFANDARTTHPLFTQSSSSTAGRQGPPDDFLPPLQLHIPHARRPYSQTRTEISPKPLPKSIRALPDEPLLRTASGRNIALRHPTPDLQVLQGAYTGNITHLDRMAEQLSMTSSIDDAIKQLHDEQKRSDSRRSSVLSNQGMAAVTRQVSNPASIVDVNSTARSGGYSPAGYMMSPKSSISGGNGHTRVRSASKSSKYGSRPEPEMEGRPLDSFVQKPSMHSSSISPISPNLVRTISVEEQNEEEFSTLPLSIAEPASSEPITEKAPNLGEEHARPQTSASTIDENGEEMFEGFDGIHAAPISMPPPVPAHVTFPEEDVNPSEYNVQQRRTSSGNRLSMARPQSYADPHTGQEMVYYPAPVPMMLNLPQKLSKLPSATARNKRRSQVMSGVPLPARQSAIWLPDVLENEGEVGVQENDEEAQGQEYMAQHHRASIGGRRLTQDLSHMPPQLRASTFFDIPGPTQIVELKDQSAVATLDSILDASAHAPVTAFTDHTFAGHLGAEVYGRESIRHNRSSTQLLDQSTGHKKRTSSFNLLLGGRRASTMELDSSDKDKRRSTITGLVESPIRSPLEEDEDELNDAAAPDHSEMDDVLLQNEDDFDEERDGEVYHGPPTTLLAELQLRKQQNKQRTKPIAKQYPNGTHSTLLQLDAVAQVQKNSRKKKRTILAWEDPDAIEQADQDEDDEDVPLAMLYAQKTREDANRPMGLMERREMEDNEPLSARRNRLQGRPNPVPRASTMMNVSGYVPPEEAGETLAQRVRRIKEAGGTVTGLPADAGLPAARPVSGDFASEMMSQLGGEMFDKGKGKGIEPAFPSPQLPEEEETLGQRRKRLQAEREARAREVGLQGGEAVSDPPVQAQQQRPDFKPRRSMADILQAHPSAGAERAVNYQRPAGGLLGLHEKQSARRANTLTGFDTGNVIGGPAQRAAAAGEKTSAEAYKRGLYNDGQGGIIPTGGGAPAVQPPYNMNMYNPSAIPFAQPSMPFANPYATMGAGMGYAPRSPMQLGFMPGFQGMGGMPMPMMQMPMMGMPMMGLGPPQPLNQGQIDMVERWRQSVMQ